MLCIPDTLLMPATRRFAICCCRKEEKASAAGEISAPNLRLMLATREEEAERQVDDLLTLHKHLHSSDWISSSPPRHYSLGARLTHARRATKTVR